MNFVKALDVVLLHEGGYVDHPRDPGGATKYGITERVARQHDYHGDMRDFPIEQAREIYLMSYWIPIKGDELPDPLRLSVFDAAVNSGVRRATHWLQEVVEVKQDGFIGPVTLNAVRARDPFDVACRYNARRLLFMTNLNTFTDFGRGWVRRVASNMMEEL